VATAVADRGGQSASHKVREGKQQAGLDERQPRRQKGTRLRRVQRAATPPARQRHRTSPLRAVVTARGTPVNWSARRGIHIAVIALATATAATTPGRVAFIAVAVWKAIGPNRVHAAPPGARYRSPT
jgi:hypothetical protein